MGPLPGQADEAFDEEGESKQGIEQRKQLEREKAVRKKRKRDRADSSAAETRNAPDGEKAS
jgi:hypothetical protein